MTKTCTAMVSLLPIIGSTQVTLPFRILLPRTLQKNILALVLTSRLLIDPSSLSLLTLFEGGYICSEISQRFQARHNSRCRHEFFKIHALEMGCQCFIDCWFDSSYSGCCGSDREGERNAHERFAADFRSTGYFLLVKLPRRGCDNLSIHPVGVYPIVIGRTGADYGACGTLCSVAHNLLSGTDGNADVIWFCSVSFRVLLSAGFPPKCWSMCVWRLSC